MELNENYVHHLINSCYCDLQVALVHLLKPQACMWLILVLKSYQNCINCEMWQFCGPFGPWVQQTCRITLAAKQQLEQ